MKSQVAILALVPENQLVMQRILRCDYKGFKSILSQIEASADSKSQINSILNERCDGNRNIIHACVSMCSPASNKDNDDSSSTNLPGANIGSGPHSALDCNLDTQFPCYQVSLDMRIYFKENLLDSVICRMFANFVSTFLHSDSIS